MSDYDLSVDDIIDLSGIQYKPNKSQTKSNAKQPITIDSKESPTVNFVENILAKKIPVKTKPLKQTAPKKKAGKDIPTEKEQQALRRSRLAIKTFLNEFPAKLKDFKGVKYENKTQEELDELIKEMNFTMSNSQILRVGTQFITKGVSAFEFLLVNFSPVNATGLSNICCNDPDFLDDVKLITLKHCHMTSTEPEQRALFKILTTTLALHQMNESLANISKAAIKSEDTIKNINNEYSDI